MATQHVPIQYYLLKYDKFTHKSADMTIYVYGALQKHAHNNKVTIGMEALEKITGITSRQITNHINILIKHGFVSRTHYVYSMNQSSKNTYTLHCSSEEGFAQIAHEIAFKMDIYKPDVIAYANLKRLIDFNKNDYLVKLSKKQLAKELQTSLNNVDKIKRRLKEAGLIDYDSKTITLIWDKNNFVSAPKKSRKQQVKTTIEKHTQEVEQDNITNNKSEQ